MVAADVNKQPAACRISTGFDFISFIRDQDFGCRTDYRVQYPVQFGLVAGYIPGVTICCWDNLCIFTFHNERREEFPQWIKLAWHNCLVGCLYCQKACPVNKDVPISIKEGPVFSEKETELILQGMPKDEFPQSTIEKVESLDMISYLPVLGRNLRVLHEQFKEY